METAQQALTRVVNRCIANGAPVIVEQRPPTACGHLLPAHHEFPWHIGDTLYCSARCMGEALLTVLAGN
jgi:hypothetical protein